MPNLLEAAPRDLHLLIDLSFKELLHLQLVVNHMTFHFDGQKKEHREAAEYLSEVFAPWVNNTIKDINNDR